MKLSDIKQKLTPDFGFTEILAFVWGCIALALFFYSFIHPVYVYLKYGDFSNAIKNYQLHEAYFNKITSNLYYGTSSWRGIDKLINWYGELHLYSTFFLFLFVSIILFAISEMQD